MGKHGNKETEKGAHTTKKELTLQRQRYQVFTTATDRQRSQTGVRHPCFRPAFWRFLSDDDGDKQKKSGTGAAQHNNHSLPRSSDVKFSPHPTAATARKLASVTHSFKAWCFRLSFSTGSKAARNNEKREGHTSQGQQRQLCTTSRLYERLKA